MNKTIVQFFKFGIVGVLSFLIDEGILNLLMFIFGSENGGLNILFSVISFSISVVFNYVCSMKFVFKGKEDMDKKTEFTIFLILSVIGLFINTACMWVCDFLPFDTLTAQFVNVAEIGEKGFRQIVVSVHKLVATFIVMVWNFISRKLFLEEKDGEPPQEIRH